MSTIAPEGKEMKNRVVLYKNPFYCQENTGLWNGPEKVTFGGVQLSFTVAPVRLMRRSKLTFRFTVRRLSAVRVEAVVGCRFYLF